MPRSVAAVVGFALVAFSIGFNTMRYPAVWDMVGPATAGEPKQSEALLEKADVPAPTPSEPAPPQDVVAPAPLRAKGDSPIFADTKIGTVPSEKPPAENPSPAKESRPSSDDRPTAEPADSAQPERLAPLVPVTLFPSSNASANDVASGAGIRRLPPVDPKVGVAVALPSQQKGSIPVYPSTGIE